MKNLLIIALPRSGGTTFMSKMGKELGLPVRFEPELTSWPVEPKNDVTKVIVDKFQFIDIVALAENYENVILHSRHDILACAESMAAMTWHWKDGTDHSQHPWKANKLASVPQWYIEQTCHRITHCQLLMHVLSQELNLPIQYYEDMYDLNSDERFRKETGDDTLI